MKLSVSVPDELWAAVTNGLPRTSPSKVIQDALSLVLERRRAGETPFSRAPNEAVLERLLESGLGASLDRLADEAVTAEAQGYEAGVRAASSEPWTTLERATNPQVVISWFRDDTAEDYRPQNLLHALINSAKEARQVIEHSFGYEFGDSFLKGFAAGVADTRQAVQAHRETTARRRDG